MVKDEFCNVTGSIIDPNKRNIRRVSLNEKVMRSILDLSPSDIGVSRTLMVLKVHDDNDKLNLPESVRVSPEQVKSIQATTNQSIYAVISHAIMPDKYKGTVLGASFNRDQKVFLVTDDQIDAIGLGGSGYITSLRHLKSNEKNNGQGKGVVLAA